MRGRARAERIASLQEADRISSTLTQLNGIFPGLCENFEGGTSKVWMDDLTLLYEMQNRSTKSHEITRNRNILGVVWCDFVDRIPAFIDGKVQR